MSIRVYQAGPIDQVNDYGLGWRRRLKQNYPGVEWVDPTEKEFEDGQSRDEALAEWEPQEMVVADYQEIASCDAMLVHWEVVPTCGTPMEVAFSSIVPPLATMIQTMGKKLTSIEHKSPAAVIIDEAVAAGVPDWLTNLVLSMQGDIPVVVQTTVDGYDLSYFLRTHSDSIVETYEEAVEELHRLAGVEEVTV